MRFSSSPRGTVILAYRRRRDSDAARPKREAHNSTPGFMFDHPHAAMLVFFFFHPTINEEQTRKNNTMFKGNALGQRQRLHARVTFFFNNIMFDVVSSMLFDLSCTENRVFAQQVHRNELK